MVESIIGGQCVNGLSRFVLCCVVSACGVAPMWSFFFGDYLRTIHAKAHKPNTPAKAESRMTTAIPREDHQKPTSFLDA